MNKLQAQKLCLRTAATAWRSLPPPPRHGLSSVLAMLYLVLFSTLAVGFYAASTMSGQISKNQRALEKAQAAADGGMQFIRYQLGLITLDPNTPTSGIMTAVATALGQQLNGTSNMNGNNVQNNNGTIYIPAANSWTVLDPSVGTQFRAMITQSGTFLVVTVDGTASNTGVVRAIQLQYQKAPRAGYILDYGVASEGTITTAGSAIIQGASDPTKGSVLSADMSTSTPINIGGSAVSGDLSVVNPSANIAVASGSSVAGSTNPSVIAQHIHKGVPSPTFPWIDTSMFTAYATNAYPYAAGSVLTSATLTDVVIPPNTNPKFTGSVTINGVLYIESPNVVTFKGGTTINGVIVTDPTGSFDAVNNQINFGGSVTATPLSALPTTNPAYDPNLVKLSGSFLLAPNYAVSMTGNFGTIGGSVVAGTMNMSGNATGTIDGSLIGMHDNGGSGSSSSVYLNGSSDITIASKGTTQYPTGMNFGNDYTPLPGTYIEVAPW